MAAYELVPGDHNPSPPPAPGDFLLCHRRGLASAAIRWGERIRFRSGARWSHTAFVETPGTVIEALTSGVTRTPLAAYRDIEYLLVRTGLDPHDQVQAVRFARSCLGQSYGWLTILGIAFSILGPRWLSLTAGSSKICSGLVAQAQVRGPKIFSVDPGSLSPAQLAEEYAAPAASR